MRGSFKLPAEPLALVRIIAGRIFFVKGLNYMNLGENIKKAREAAGLTQGELAEKLGTTQIAISRWENNNRTPNVITFGKMCSIIGASADELLEVKR